MKETGILDWNPGRGRTTRASLMDDFRDGFCRVLAGEQSVGPLAGHIEFRDWGDFYAGLATHWSAILEIAQRSYDGSARSLRACSVRISRHQSTSFRKSAASPGVSRSWNDERAIDSADTCWNRRRSEAGVRRAPAGKQRISDQAKSTMSTFRWR